MFDENYPKSPVGYILVDRYRYGIQFLQAACLFKFFQIKLKSIKKNRVYIISIYTLKNRDNNAKNM